MKKSPPLAKNARKSKRSTVKPKTKKPKAVPRGMVKVVKGTLKKMKPLKASKYDGVLGMPPSWVPEPEKRRFFAARIALIETFSDKEIRKLIASRKRIQGKDFTQTLFVPPELEDKVDTLIDIKKLVDRKHVAVAVLEFRLRLLLRERTADVLDDARAFADGFCRVRAQVMDF